jgi:hypothetical protein
MLNDKKLTKRIYLFKRRNISTVSRLLDVQAYSRQDFGDLSRIDFHSNAIHVKTAPRTKLFFEARRVNVFIVQVYSAGFPFRNDGRVRTASGWTLVVRMQLACDLVVIPIGVV